MRWLINIVGEKILKNALGPPTTILLTRQSSTDVEQCRQFTPRDFLFWLQRGMYGFKKCLENEEVETQTIQYNTNAPDKIILAV